MKYEMKIAVEFLSERDWGIYSNYNYNCVRRIICIEPGVINKMYLQLADKSFDRFSYLIQQYFGDKKQILL